MSAKLRRWLDVRPGEGPALAYCCALVALAVAGFLLAKPIRDGLYVTQYGASKLVYAYVAVPIVISLFLPAVQLIGVRVGPRRLITGLLLFFALNVAGFWWGFRAGAGRMLSGPFYVWVGCFGVMAPVQAWSFANSVFDTRQARRLFGLVGAGASLGAILGGLLAGTLPGQIGTINLLLVLLVLIVAMAVIVNLAWGVRRREPPGRRSPVLLRATLRTIARRPYLRNIALLVFLVAIVTQWTQFMFKVELVEQLGRNTDAVTQFLGRFNFLMGVAAFFVQLIFTGPALRRFGVGVTILLLPLMLGAGTLSVVVWPVLLTVMMTNGFDQGLRFSVDKATFELLYLPLPSSERTHVKSAIDLLVSRLADGVGGVTLGLLTAEGFGVGLFKIPGLGLDVRGVAAAALIVVGAWLVVASALRRGYVDAIRESVTQHRLNTERMATPVLDRSASEALGRRIDEGDEREILYALSVFEAGHHGAMHPAVHGLLAHPAAEVRRRALAVLDAAGDTSALPGVERLLRDSDLDVRTEALLFFAHHVDGDPLERIQQLGDVEDFSIQAGLVAFLSRPGPTQNLEAARLVMERMIDSHGPNGQRSRVEAARLLGSLPPDLARRALSLLGDEDAGVVRTALGALGRTRDFTIAPELIARLGEPRVRDAAADALVALGPAAVDALAAALVDPAVRIEVRREVPPVLARLGTPAAQEALMASLLQAQVADVVLRSRIIRGLARLHHLHPELEVDGPAVETVMAAEILGHYRSYQILGSLGDAFDHRDPVVIGLHETMAQERERIFELMGLRWPEFDLGSVWVGLQADSRTVAANAMELLDHQLDSALAEIVLPLFDGQLTVADRVRIANRLIGTRVQSREAAVAAMLASEEPYLVACGVRAVGMLRLDVMRGEVQRHAEADDPLLRATARAALQRLDTPSAEPGPAQEDVWFDRWDAAGMG